ncbi:helix-turn-helix domain-containing protein [Rhizobium leguminosarum bv. viciae]|uniref:helix-turn-helix domain-containing protein n=1 Tax=Rhizobium leguminosarum TaxID=384 RepID=UPI00140FC7C6|nr:helix-turn-helix transcriptional regulator [Rhizobium leguminosarum]NKJ95519.1 helix-turn-helix domain-containing protein [Rhizobium leguminosarum bv. viciae]QIO58036.1 helix-turn-helix transcriptional regulator [Rhizobium leguminosarum bv. trifolii]
MANKVRELSPLEVIIAEDALMDFQFAVINAMREKNISKTELAEQLGISKARISQMLSSDANPTLKVVGRIIAALDLKAQYVGKQAAGVAIKEKTFDWPLSIFNSSGMAWHNDNKKERRVARTEAPIAA